MSADEPVGGVAEARDDGEAAAVIREHGPAILRYLRALLREEAMASDAFSLTTEWIWRSMPTFRGTSSVRTWAFGIAWNAARRLREDPWHWRRELLHSSTASRLAAEVQTASAQEVEHRADRLAELRRELTPDEQNLLVLRIDQGLDWKEIAEVVSASGERVSEAALRKRFERTKAKISKLAKERGIIE